MSEPTRKLSSEDRAEGYKAWVGDRTGILDIPSPSKAWHDGWDAANAQVERPFEGAAELEPAAIDGEMREAIRIAIGGVLCNASNFPAKVTPHILGQDMGPLIGRTAAAVIARLAAPSAAAASKATQHDVDSHASKQDVSYSDAWRYFERQGYDMADVDPQYS